MESPGGEIRASQEGLGKLRLEQGGSGGDLGKGDAGALARSRGSLTWREQGGRSPLQSADTKPGSPRGRDARPGRGARALCLRVLQPLGPAPTPPPARTPPPPTLRVSGSPALGGDLNLGLVPAPCARLLCSLREHGWSRGPRSAQRGVGKARFRGPRPELPPCVSRSPIPRPPRLPCPRLAGVRFHGEVPGRLRERRQRHRGGGAVLYLSPSRPVPPLLCPTTWPTSTS